jgi:NADP-dependent 3-hydroxy acid dehydrogenase YdfG
MNTSITGKVVAITGASSGIGEATGRYLASQGANVVLGARRMNRLVEIKRQIENSGGVAEISSLDVTDFESVKLFVGLALSRFGRLDVFINNAGIMPLSYLNSYKVEEWNRTVNVNIKGVLHGIAAALPHFESVNRGHFINVSSIADRWVGPTSTVYSATKFAVRTITEGLRQEVSESIRVTLVAPGSTESELAESISDENLKRFAIEKFRVKVLPSLSIAKAIGYAIAQPDDVDVNEIVVRPTSQKW